MVVGLVLATTCCGADAGHAESDRPTSTATSDRGRDVGIEDDGSVLHLQPGESADLVVRDPSAPDPLVLGDAVTLVEVDNARPSGVREWEIRAVLPGHGSIEATERGHRFTITVTVAG